MKMPIVICTAAIAALSGCVGYAPVPSEPVYSSGGPVYRSDGRGDRDRDGVPNRADRDRDGDGVRNRDDRRPNNPNRY
jgi:hypothetical protein